MEHGSCVIYERVRKKTVSSVTFVFLRNEFEVLDVGTREDVWGGDRGCQWRAEGVRRISGGEGVEGVSWTPG